MSISLLKSFSLKKIVKEKVPPYQHHNFKFESKFKNFFSFHRIERFSVIPLSTNTGLIGWVPNSDTMHSLIREYRDKTDITLNQEHREMLHLAPDFDRLNLSQKTEVFEAGLRVSSGRDLANILWYKSHNSEVCFG